MPRRLARDHGEEGRDGVTDLLRRQRALQLIRGIKSVDDIDHMPADYMLTILEALFEESPVAAATLFHHHVADNRAEYVGLAVARIATLKSANPIDLQQIKEVEALLDLFRRA